MNVSELKTQLDEISRVTTNEWMASLTPRGVAELEFHNKNREATAESEAKANDTYEKFYGNKKYYSATYRSKAYLYDWIARHSPDKVVLDYACGSGALTLKAAEAGAKLAIGLDISDVSIRLAQAEAKR